jgi:hypothetical protein
MSNFNLTILPSQAEYVLKPGVTIIQAYDVINNSDFDITLNTQILPWIPFGSDGSVSYNQAINNPDIEFSLANANLKINEAFVLKANSKQQLVLKIKTNPNINLADNYYTFFIYQSQNTIQSNNNFSQATGKIGSHLLLTVSNTENPKTDSIIQNFSITPKIKDVFFRPINFQAQVRNNSDFFFKIGGKITITKNGKTVKELDLNPNNVLNHHSRNISCQNQTTCSLNPPLWPGHYNLKMELDPSLNAKSYDSSFYVLPISPILFLILITGIILGIKFFKKKKALIPTKS